eukprot:CAMPEP_0198253932 /NCGR_PEP_ID=MMETSP1447-20131203/4312_1 /TAXON_ID=420782 /ORGANISM="Chaetoceros dichaeta, Strain CCMP1751" /LENGTH=176 /DNA_ID=CAMNT_0043939803 /DNA_START=253 /DNA_END=783 /DNA_ORIENTATION=-
MANHPDTFQKDDAEDEKKVRTRRFQRARQALEALICDEDNGLCVLRSEVEQLEDLTSKDSMSDSEFDAWFLDETGLNSPFDLDPATMREVAEATENSSIGLDRDGGMWTLARMVTAKVNEAKESGGPVENILKLEAGKGSSRGDNVGAQSIEEGGDGKVRRRRRKSSVGNSSTGRR